MAFAHDPEGAKPRDMSRDSPREPTDPVSIAEQPAAEMRERASEHLRFADSQILGVL